jgi:hypothetical protein
MATTTGTNRRFIAEATTTRPHEVWRLWTTPGSWGAWDAGLASAELEGQFDIGASGVLTDLSGRRSAFLVTEIDPVRRCAYEVRLPAATLRLVRTIGTGSPAVVRHEVCFVGPMAVVWSWLLGRAFRRQIGPTVDALVAAAERADRPGSSDREDRESAG